MNRPLRVLLVEDSEDDVRLIVRELEQGGYTVQAERVETAPALAAALQRDAWDIVLCDYRLPQFDGREALRLLQASGRDLPFIMVSGTIGEEVAVEMMKAGAHDYLMKDNLARLGPAVEHELRDAVDRAERRRMEAELLASESRYRRLFESTKDGILILNAATGTIVDVNPFLLELLGLSREQLIGRRMWGVGSFQAFVRDQAAFTELGGHADLRFEDKALVAADGRRIEVEFVSTVYPVDHHTVMQCNFRDIRERKRAELALRESEERLHEQEARYRALVEKAYEAVSVLDAEGRITFSSPSCERLLGYRPDEMVGLSAFDLVHPDDRGLAREQLAGVLQQAGGGVTFELRGLHHDGTVRWFELTVSNLLHIPNVRGVVVNYRDSTEKKRIESALLRSEKYYRALTDHSLDLVTVLEADGRVRYESPSVERILGWKQGDLVGRNAFDLVHPDDAGRLREALAEALPKPGAIRSVEFRCRRQDGSWVVLETIASNLLLDPTVAGLVLNSRDITQRMQVETALRDSETQFRQLFGQMLSGVLLCEVICDESGIPRDHRFLNGNPAFEKLTGVSVREQRGRTSKDFAISWPPDVTQKFYQVALTGEPIQYTRYNESLGRTYETRVFSPRPGQFAHVFNDVTERVQVEESLRKEQALFQSLVTAIPDNLYFKDRQSRFVMINDDMAHRCGMASAADAIGKTDFDLYGPEHAKQAFADEQRMMETGEPIIGLEEKETWPDGRVTWVSTTKMPLRDAQGRVTGLVGISRDITDRKHLEAQFLQSQKLEAFGQLAGGVAHDFNNILGVMLMQLNLLQMEKGLSGTVVTGLAELERHAMRGAGLTRQLLMFSRRQAMEPRTLDLNLLLEDVSKMLRRVLGEHIAYELHKAPGPVWIEADTGMIEQVLMNLCINARDAMHNGGQLTIETRLVACRASGSGAPGNYACLAVTDTGCGMDEATKARIFEPFFTTKPAGMGTGLGLATVYGIVQQHHGWVEVDSAPGRGTTFRVFFPMRKQQGAAEDAAALSEVPGGHESILLVEDEPALRSSMSMSLQLAGYQVKEAASGPEALQQWEEGGHEFDLLITDYLMPGGVTGVHLATLLTRAKENLKVIVMSGYIPGNRESTPPWQIKSTRLNKPFEARTLLRTVRQCLDDKPVS